MRILSLGLIIVGLLASCGNQVEFHDSYRGDPQPKPEVSNWVSVASVELHVGTTEQVSEVGNYDSYNLAVQNVTYISTVVNNVNIDLASLVIGAEDGSEILDLGSVDIQTLKINDLSQCGVGGDQACSTARVVIYTTELGSDPGISGFVNTDDGYGVQVLAGGLDAGLTDVNGAEVDTYVIQNGDRRVSHQDFLSGPYLLGIDFSNAGAGNYEMDLVIDIQLGL